MLSLAVNVMGGLKVFGIIFVMLATCLRYMRSCVEEGLKALDCSLSPRWAVRAGVWVIERWFTVETTFLNFMEFGFSESWGIAKLGLLHRIFKFSKIFGP